MTDSATSMPADNNTDIVVDVQFAAQSEYLPEQAAIKQWVQRTIKIAPYENKTIQADFELTVRIVDEQEITALNQQYRQQDKTTNVLSFPYEAMAGIEIGLLGDVVVCADVVNREAHEQGKLPEHHWAHMVVHGVLHLLGYDHIEPHDADTMEALEINILDTLGISNPYQANDNER